MRASQTAGYTEIESKCTHAREKIASADWVGPETIPFFAGKRITHRNGFGSYGAVDLFWLIDRDNFDLEKSHQPNIVHIQTYNDLIFWIVPFGLSGRTVFGVAAQFYAWYQRISMRNNVWHCPAVIRVHVPFNSQSNRGRYCALACRVWYDLSTLHYLLTFFPPLVIYFSTFAEEALSVKHSSLRFFVF